MFQKWRFISHRSHHSEFSQTNKSKISLFGTLGVIIHRDIFVFLTVLHEFLSKSQQQKWRLWCESWAISFSCCVRCYSCSVVLQWAKFTSLRALVPWIRMDRSSLYEYVMRKHSKIKLFASTCFLIDFLIDFVIIIICLQLRISFSQREWGNRYGPY